MARQKKEKNIVTIGHNSLQPTKDKIAKAAKEVAQLEAERTEINAKLAEVRAAVEALGIPKKAFAATVQYIKMDIDQRAGLDQGYILAREAVGLPVKGAQLELEMEDEQSEAA